MNGQKTQITTEQAHNNLQGLLLNGRILINGLPLSGNELGAIVQGEQMLFEKAMKFDAATALAAQKLQVGKGLDKTPVALPVNAPGKGKKK